MVFAAMGIDRPRRLRVAVQRRGDGIAVLLEVGLRIDELQPGSLARTAFRFGRDGKLAQGEVAPTRAAGAAFYQRLVGQRFETDGRDPWQVRPSDEGIRVLV